MFDIWTWSATEIAAQVAAGDVSAREVAEATLARIAEVEPRLNALSEITEDTALSAADAVDAARARGEAPGPLAGVPVTTKNNVDQAGTLNTGGIAQGRQNRATEDSPLVAGLKAAGAVIVGRTNVPAYSLRWFTDTDLHGRTLNPFDPALSPGGSSGGAGVAVAAGMGALAYGNDIGGSIRHPAHMNAVAGLRPTVGRVPSYVASGGGARALTSQLITSEGPLARCVADLRLGLNAMAVADARDPQTVPMPPVGMGRVPARVGVMSPASLGASAPEVRAALERAEAALASAGADVAEVDLPGFWRAHGIWLELVFNAVRYHDLDTINASGDSALIRKVETVMQIVPVRSAGEIADLWMERLQIMRAWSLIFAETPILVLPVSLRHGLRIDADQGDVAAVEALLHDQAPLLATALLGPPCLALPTGLASNGAPTGVQLAARWWDEATLFAAGEVIEAACPPITPI